MEIYSLYRKSRIIEKSGILKNINIEMAVYWYHGSSLGGVGLIIYKLPNGWHYHSLNHTSWQGPVDEITIRDKGYTLNGLKEAYIKHNFIPIEGEKEIDILIDYIKNKKDW